MSDPPATDDDQGLSDGAPQYSMNQLDQHIGRAPAHRERQWEVGVHGEPF